MTRSLGSRTSGVDGSSEGGRINTISLPGALVIYGVALVQYLQSKGVKSRLTLPPGGRALERNTALARLR